MRLEADGKHGRPASVETGAATPAAPPVTIDWPAVREAYVGGIEPVAAIRRRFGITEAQLRWWRMRAGWVRRRPAGGGPLALSAEDALGFAASAQARIVQLIVGAVERIEERAMRDGALSPDDLPALIGLAQALEHVMKSTKPGGSQGRRGGSPASEAKGHGHAGHDRRDAGQDSDGGGRDGDGGFDADAARAELKGRLDRLRRGSRTGCSDRGGEP